MSRIFQYKDFPFLLTLLFGLLGYQLNSITDALINSPAIEYKISSKVYKTDKDMVFSDNECTVTNLSNSKSFDRLKVDFTYPKNVKAILDLKSPEIIAVKPSSLHGDTIPHSEADMIVFRLGKLQPGFQYKLLYKTQYLKDVENPHPDLNLTTDNTVRLLESSFTTWLIKNYNSISVILSVFWALLIIIYLIKFKPTI